MVYRQRVDAATGSALALCDCGWRTLMGDRGSAWRMAHDHALRAHPGDVTNNVHDAARRWK